MKYTKLALELQKARENNDELSPELENLACCAGSESFGYALFDGGYIRLEDWLEGEDLEKMREAVKLVESFKAFFESVAEEM